MPDVCLTYAATATMIFTSVTARATGCSWRMLTYADVCLRMPDVCLTYADSYRDEEIHKRDRESELLELKKRYWVYLLLLVQKYKY